MSGEPKKKCTSGRQPAGGATAHSKKTTKIASEPGSSEDAPPQQPAEVAAVVCKQQKAPRRSKAGLSVIDDIFGKPTADASPASRQGDARGVRPPKNDSTQAKRSSAAAALAAGNAPASKKVKTKKVAGSKDDLFGSDPVNSRRFDAEGLPVFSTDELGIGRGSNTQDCPFDCDCCY